MNTSSQQASHIFCVSDAIIGCLLSSITLFKFDILNVASHFGGCSCEVSYLLVSDVSFLLMQVIRHLQCLFPLTC